MVNNKHKLRLFLQKLKKKRTPNLNFPLKLIFPLNQQF